MKAPKQLSQWDELTVGVASELLTVECHRTLDQLWHRGELTDRELAEQRPLLLSFLERLDIQPLDQRVLHLASQPLPTSLATLDAIHLATAMIYRAGRSDGNSAIRLATHDRRLAKAAAALDFEVIGIAA